MLEIRVLPLTAWTESQSPDPFGDPLTVTAPGQQANAS